MMDWKLCAMGIVRLQSPIMPARMYQALSHWSSSWSWGLPLSLGPSWGRPMGHREDWGATGLPLPKHQGEVWDGESGG